LKKEFSEWDKLAVSGAEALQIEPGGGKERLCCLARTAELPSNAVELICLTGPQAARM
jgi:hypothetical protein